LAVDAMADNAHGFDVKKKGKTGKYMLIVDPHMRTISLCIRGSGDPHMHVGYHTHKITLPVMPLTVPVTLPILVL
jgi:hypothetical protein